jgi:FkbM family methyltransferase
MNIVTLISRRRWSKRLFGHWLPLISSSKLKDGFEIFFNPRDMHGPSFHFSYDLERGFNNYEQSDRDFFQTLCPNEAVVFDVGANIGLFSLFLARTRPDLNVHAFEPDATTFACLEKSVQANHLGKLRLHHFGLGEIDEILDLHHHQKNDGGHSLIPTDEMQPEGAQKVQVKNLDLCLERGELPVPQAIKIDVEGFELSCLKGMLSTIQKYKPALMVECLNKNLRPDHELYELFNSLQEDGAVFRTTTTREPLDLQALELHALERLKQGHGHDNYFVTFKPA